MLPIWNRVDLGAIEMKEYSAFLKASALLASPSDCLESLVGEPYPSEEMQSAYSAAPAD